MYSNSQKLIQPSLEEYIRLLELKRDGIQKLRCRFIGKPPAQIYEALEKQSKDEWIPLNEDSEPICKFLEKNLNHTRVIYFLIDKFRGEIEIMLNKEPISISLNIEYLKWFPLTKKIFRITDNPSKTTNPSEEIILSLEEIRFVRDLHNRLTKTSKVPPTLPTIFEHNQKLVPTDLQNVESNGDNFGEIKSETEISSEEVKRINEILLQVVTEYLPPEIRTIQWEARINLNNSDQLRIELEIEELCWQTYLFLEEPLQTYTAIEEIFAEVKLASE